jgi:hypothetical protein
MWKINIYIYIFSITPILSHTNMVISHRKNEEWRADDIFWNFLWSNTDLVQERIFIRNEISINKTIKDLVFIECLSTWWAKSSWKIRSCCTTFRTECCWWTGIGWRCILIVFSSKVWWFICILIWIKSTTCTTNIND